LALFFRLARRVASVGAASLATLVVGLATGVCYYARSPYTEALQTFSFTGFALAVFEGLDEPTPAAARRLGLWAGLLFHAKLVLFLALPGVAAVFAWRLRREPRRLVGLAGWAALVMAPFAALLLLYNVARWGSPFTTGYDEPLGGMPLWRGCWGLLFSPGKSVFLYSPPLVVGLFGMAALARSHGRFVVALLAALGPVFLFYCGYLNWDGDWAWGPRYLTFALPALCLPIAMIFDSLRAALPAAGRLRALAVTATCAAGLTVQIIGCSLYWGYWFRIASAASEQWLGLPHCAPTVAHDKT
jgi:hypothetical protein